MTEESEREVERRLESMRECFDESAQVADGSFTHSIVTPRELNSMDLDRWSETIGPGPVN
jgi:hypothetical protein